MEESGGFEFGAEKRDVESGVFELEIWGVFGEMGEVELADFSG